MLLAPHFSLAELTYSQTAIDNNLSNEPTGVDLRRLTETAWRMEIVRVLLGGAPISVSSGYRNEKVNRLVGGVPNSDHRLGYAVDFRRPGFNVAKTVKILRESALEYDQLINEYNRWVHISFNPRMRRQTFKVG